MEKKNKYGLTYLEWKKEVRKQQIYYRSLKFQKIKDDILLRYYLNNYTPIETCNDINYWAAVRQLYGIPRS